MSLLVTKHACSFSDLGLKKKLFCTSGGQIACMFIYRPGAPRVVVVHRTSCYDKQLAQYGRQTGANDKDGMSTIFIFISYFCRSFVLVNNCYIHYVFIFIIQCPLAIEHRDQSKRNVNSFE